MNFYKPALFMVAVLAASFIFSNCASLTGFQTGRTVGKGNGELMFSLNASQSPDFELDVNFDDTADIKNFFFPNLEGSVRYGIIEKLDVGARLNTNFNLAFDARYQLIGDRYSPVALSAGMGVGTFGLFAALWNLQIPLYFSIHPSPIVDIYISPRYIAQFAAGDIQGKLNYLGGNAGIMIGKRTKFGIDLGYYKVTAIRQDILPLTTIGFGAKIPLE